MNLIDAVVVVAVDAAADCDVDDDVVVAAAAVDDHCNLAFVSYSQLKQMKLKFSLVV